MRITTVRAGALLGSGVVSVALVVASSATANASLGHDDHGDGNRVAVTQTNLIADQVGQAPLIDPNLINPWGMSFGTGATPTPVWVSDNGANVSTLYSGATTPPSFAKVPLTVSIPGGAPTGQVFNSSATDFVVHGGSASGAAKFIFDSEAGWIVGWNPTVPAAGSTQATPAVHIADAVFKGLALASVDGANYLYATDFHHGTVDVFDSTFTLQHWSDAFRDKHIPDGYAPFNIALLNGNLYVTYAKQDAAKHDDVAGSGHGFVDVFSTSGHLLNRLVARGGLNSPWGLAIAPSSWGSLAGSLLVGNFGNGRIHAYDPNSGHALGALRDASGNKITIDGLWGLLPGNGVAADPQSVIFSAGPDGEAHGLVGVLQAAIVSGNDGDSGGDGDHGMQR
jgi:uncharacterized protein (TIGR03118 family)